MNVLDVQSHTICYPPARVNASGVTLTPVMRTVYLFATTGVVPLPISPHAIEKLASGLMATIVEVVEVVVHDVVDYPGNICVLSERQDWRHGKDR